jgi:uncharacterized damage-inducible protein DinB
MYDYVRWCDDRQLDAARTVPPRGYHQDFGFSFKTVHDTLLHMVSAQVIWLARWEGEIGVKPLTRHEFPELEPLRVHWGGVHAQLGDFLHRLGTHSLSRRLEWTNSDGKFMTLPMGHLIVHCLEHATYHRGQLNSLIKLAGGVPARVMYYTWMLDTHAR